MFVKLIPKVICLDLIIVNWKMQTYQDKAIVSQIHIIEIIIPNECIYTSYEIPKWVNSQYMKKKKFFMPLHFDLSTGTASLCK